MQNVMIDCAGIAAAPQLHDVLARALAFPDWYGGNLDALYDCLTAICTDTQIHFQHMETLENWKQGFLYVFEDACQANPRLQIFW